MIQLVLRSGRCDRNRSFLLLTGTSWDLNNAAVKQESVSGPSDDSSGSGVSHMFLFFFSFVFPEFIQLVACTEGLSLGNR